LRSGHRIHKDQHVLAFVTEIFGDSERHVRGLAAHQCRLVGGRHDDDRAGETRIAQIVLKEFLHLAAAFTDQPDDSDVGGDVAGKHGEQHRFADTGAGENAHALAAAAGDEGVKGANAEIERGADPAPRVRQRRCAAEWIRRRTVEQCSFAVDWLA
jgi:hypothetical protein